MYMGKKTDTNLDADKQVRPAQDVAPINDDDLQDVINNATRLTLNQKMRRSTGK